jgi:hypothetical protein
MAVFHRLPRDRAFSALSVIGGHGFIEITERES